MNKNTELKFEASEPGSVNLVDFPYSFAKRNGVVLQRSGDGGLVVYYKKGLTPAISNEVNRFLEKDAVFKLIENDEFEHALARHYDNSGAGASAMMDDLGEELDLHDVADSLPEPEDLLESEDDAPIIRLINALLTQAVKENASDIHIETYENRMVVRMRVDGVLREILEPPRSISWLPIMSILRPGSSATFAIDSSVKHISPKK